MKIDNTTSLYPATDSLHHLTAQTERGRSGSDGGREKQRDGDSVDRNQSLVQQKTLKTRQNLGARSNQISSSHNLGGSADPGPTSGISKGF